MSENNQNPQPDNESSPQQPALRLASLPKRDPLIERMMTEAIHDPKVEPYRARAQFTFFCGFDPKEFAGYDSQLEAIGRCLEWFVFDYQIPEIEKSPAEIWFEKNHILLSPQEKQTAKSALQFVLGVFEIGEVHPNDHFIAIDLLRKNKRFCVEETIISSELQPGQLLLSRLFPKAKQYTLSGMATLMSRQAATDIKLFIKEEKLVPVDILPTLDGIEMENLFGRSLTQIDLLEDLNLLHKKLQRYLSLFSPQTVTFEDCLMWIEDSFDPFNVAADLCNSLNITCRHEMDLILAYIMSTWFQTHKMD